jgi:putative oxidoreductase
MTASISPTTSNAWCLLLLRIMVGWVFLSEGIQKFLFLAALGAGRFAKIGIAAPQLTGPFVGLVEIVCGAMLIFGFATVLATIAFPHATRSRLSTTDGYGRI